MMTTMTFGSPTTSIITALIFFLMMLAVVFAHDDYLDGDFSSGMRTIPTMTMVCYRMIAIDYSYLVIVKNDVILNNDQRNK